MKDIVTCLFSLLCLSLRSQEIVYENGHDGLIVWQNNEDPDEDVLVSCFGAKSTINKEVASLVYTAYIYKLIEYDGSLDVITTDYKVKGDVEISRNNGSVLVDFTFDTIFWKDGRVEKYKPREKR